MKQAPRTPEREPTWPDYNFADPLIREMVDTKHRPMEKALYRGETLIPTPLPGVNSIECTVCRVVWPCLPVQQRRAWRQEGADVQHGLQAHPDF